VNRESLVSLERNNQSVDPDGKRPDWRRRPLTHPTFSKYRHVALAEKVSEPPPTRGLTGCSFYPY